MSETPAGEHSADKGLPPEAAPFAALWARAESKKLHREHPPPCELMATPTGRCACPTASAETAEGSSDE